jgi:RNA polymerase sigma-54 factor
MGLRQSQIQTLQQRLSPQQIQFIKLLQMSTLDFEERVGEELLDNPALEKSEVDFSENSTDFGEGNSNTDEWGDEYQRDLDVDEMIRASGNDDEYGTFRMGEDYSNEDQKEMPMASTSSFQEYLLEQARATFFDEKDFVLAFHLINSIEEDGYLRRELRSIVNDLAFNENIQTDAEKLEKILIKIQNFDPPGIAARDLQECLLLQLYKKDYGDNPALSLAETIISEQMEAFSKKHYEKITKSLKITDEQLRSAILEIVKLNPKPGESNSGSVKTQYIVPDFTVVSEEGTLIVTLNSRNAPELKLSAVYADTLKTYEESNSKDQQLKDAVQYIKQKLDGARWFIDSVKQRHHTLLSTMQAIVKRQRDFFLEGDDTYLKPMILKDIATEVGLDISTISRVANSKYVETDFGIFPLKHFFSEGISTEDGEEISNREIKKILGDAIDAENKSKPLTDEALMELLKEKGYPIARRTVAKYREQLNIPVARLRKIL